MDLIASFDIGTVNLACCVVDKNEKIHYWNVFDISASTNPLRCKKMVTQFDEVDIFKNVSTTLVEFQPSFNPKARVIEGYVSTYFIIRSIDNQSNNKVIVYSPVHKLNCYKGECPDFSYLKSLYSQRKKLSIFHTQEMIKDTQEPDILNLFRMAKKKDDLADSYLQAISYIRYKDKLPLTILKKKSSNKPTKKQSKKKSTLSTEFIEDPLEHFPSEETIIKNENEKD